MPGDQEIYAPQEKSPAMHAFEQEPRTLAVDRKTLVERMRAREKLSVNAEEESKQPLLLQVHEHDFDIRLGEYDLVRWCRRCGLTRVAYRPSPYKEFSTWREVKDEETAEHLINQS